MARFSDLSDGSRSMRPQRYPNIVWFLVDSIRTYATDLDVRGKLPFMERFGKESVEFSTCVTTAPSTIMSITAMMTGLPAYFIARNYDDFRFDNRYYYSLAGVLKEHGYASYAFLRGPETREKFATLLDPTPRAYWPDDLRHSRKWLNADLNRLLDCVLEVEVPRPAFLFFHYNPQTRFETDSAVSSRVQAAWTRLQQAGFTPENTIFVLSSDHGFPDPSTGHTSEWAAKNRMSHDLMLTEDNILIPLYIRYPQCTPKLIDTPVSSLDIFPTLLELAAIPTTERIVKRIDGLSLVPLIESSDEATYPRRFFRCDSRLMLQTARATAIRGRGYKYIRFHDEIGVAAAEVAPERAEVLIDLHNDPHESRNLLAKEWSSDSTKKALKVLRGEFERSEQRAVEFQIQYLLTKQQEKVRVRAEAVRSAGPVRALLAFEPKTAAYLKIGLKAISRLLPGAEVDVLTSEHELPGETAVRVGRVFRYAQNGTAQLRLPDGLGRYNLSILFVQNPSASVARDLLRLGRRFPARTRLILDCNFNVHQGHNYWCYRLRSFLSRVPYMMYEPQMILQQVKAAALVMSRGLLRKIGRWERWEALDHQDPTD